MKKKSVYKIFVLTDVFEPNNFGGAEVYLYNLIKTLSKKNNVSCYLVCRTNNRKFLKKLNINFSLIPTFKNEVFFIFYLLVSLITINLLFIFRNFDLILINHPFSALYALLASNKKKILIFHSPWCFEYTYRKDITVNYEARCSKTYNSKSVGFYIRLFIEQFVYRDSLYIITLSNYMKKICKKLFKTKACIYVIPPFIDIEEFNITDDKKTLREKLKIPQDKTVFFTARALIPRTGIDVLINSISIIRDKIRDCIIYISGGGDYRKHYMNLVAKLALQKYIRFLGFLDRETLIKYFYAADCFLLPSWKLEGFGLVIPEALYTNLPIIATPQGAISELLKNIPHCLISKDRTPESFAQEILKFIQRKSYWSGIDTRNYYLTNYHNPERVIEKIMSITGYSQ
ncbi:MAG: glycosyltransferase family 4 protein [Planctomycetota bacterium]